MDLLRIKVLLKDLLQTIFGDVPAGSAQLERMTIEPAQYANNAPLYSPSANASLSVATSAISANSDYGFSTNIDSDTFSMENS
jgi:hypothetical protein